MKHVNYFLWFLCSLFVIFLYTHHQFIRPTDDAKELILYTGAFILGLFALLTSIIQKREPSFQINPLKFFILIGLLYLMLNPWITPVSSNEGIVSSGRWLLLAVIAVLISKWPLKIQIFYFKGLTLLAIALILFFKKDWFQSGRFLPIGHVSYFSDFLLLLVPWPVYFFINQPKWFLKVLWLMGWGIILYGLNMGGRRAPVVGMMVATLASLPLAFIFLKKLRFRLVILALASLLTVVVIFFMHKIGPFEGVNRLVVNYQNGLASADPARFAIWKRSLQGIEERPWFGAGYGNFRFVYPKYIRELGIEAQILNERNPMWLMHPHNETLNQLFEGGMIGFLLSFIVILILFNYLIQQMKSADPEIKRIAFALFWGLAAFLISIQFTTTATNPMVRLVFISYLALIYTILKPVMPSWKIRVPRFFSLRTMQILFLGFYLFVGLAAVGYSVSSYLLTQARKELRGQGVTTSHRLAQKISPLTFDTLFRGGELEATMGNLTKAEAYFKEAYRWFPYVPLVPLKLAKTYDSQGKYKEAQELLLQAQKQYPFYQPYQTALDQMLYR